VLIDLYWSAPSNLLWARLLGHSGGGGGAFGPKRDPAHNPVLGSRRASWKGATPPHREEPLPVQLRPDGDGSTGVGVVGHEGEHGAVPRRVAQCNPTQPSFQPPTRPTEDGDPLRELKKNTPTG